MIFGGISMINCHMISKIIILYLVKS